MLCLARIATLKALLNNRPNKIIRDNNKANASECYALRVFHNLLYREFIIVQVCVPDFYHTVQCGRFRYILLRLSSLYEYKLINKRKRQLTVIFKLRITLTEL